ncbi:anthranilate synthase component I family protein [Maribacter aurantiacus]|uniref:Anthranilate synthase component I family protein n=1 Tax=Maribacter aurantiacus TaxID=1882343 RepID=A0A5R8M523_9FLAO|nr:anthranilate synthase component I family protein [Maribacter aurantiacus]TLF44688.1 anthranilate synthase component I family protein [Maribacter aurantiacus]
MRQRLLHTVDDIGAFKRSVLRWAQRFDEIVWLDSNSHQNSYTSFEALLAVDGLTAISTDHHNAFEDLKAYQSQVNDWIFGYLSYDLKNDVEALESQNFDGLEFPELYFFQPKKIIQIQGSQVEFLYLDMVADEMQSDFESISQNDFEEDIGFQHEQPSIKMRIFKDEYFNKVSLILDHIHQGDIYEVNFCQEFYCEGFDMNPLPVYERLNAISRPPFATFMKLFGNYVLCASPERFLRKVGTKIVSQPIKGTAARSLDPKKDAELKRHLEKDQKERSENVMIVDLVRNDLSKTALKGSVQVEELCKVYSFAQVHQMISTVCCEVKKDENPVDIIKNCFPMGSMTGAPKVSAMQIIEDLESFKRGVYSGAVGYFTPKGDFDFNVVIRSILYNSSKKYLSYAVGSAITAMSNPEKEYLECLLKAKAMRQVLEEV